MSRSVVEAPIAPARAALRRYFLDDTEDFPEGMSLHMWPYVGRDHVCFRGVGILDTRRRAKVVADFLLFRPLGFILLYDLTEVVLPPMSDITPQNDERVAKTTIYLNMHDRPRDDWPQTPSDHEAIVFNDASTAVARRRVRRSQQRRSGR